MFLSFWKARHDAEKRERATNKEESTGNVLAKVASGRAQLAAPVRSAMFAFDGPKDPAAAAATGSKGGKARKPFVEFTPDSPLASLSAFFNEHPAALVTAPRAEGAAAAAGEREVRHVVTKIDLLTWLMAQDAAATPSPAAAAAAAPGK